MVLDEECKGCLYRSQLKKVEKGQTDKFRLEEFRRGVKSLCQNPPENYCSPLLMRDIDRLHGKIFGKGIDYSAEKRLFNSELLKLEGDLYSEIKSSPDPLKEALKYAMAANYIDFARLADLDCGAVQTVISAAKRAEPQPAAYSALVKKLSSARTLVYLHDNCGEIVLDKIFIKIIRETYPAISVYSVVRGSAVINDVTVEDAEEVGLNEYSTILPNGSDAPGTYLQEISPEVLKLLKEADAVISKGLGNLETLYGEGYGIFYSFTCKCEHIAKKFSLPLWSAALIQEKDGRFL